MEVQEACNSYAPFRGKLCASVRLWMSVAALSFAGELVANPPPNEWLIDTPLEVGSSRSDIIFQHPIKPFEGAVTDFYRYRWNDSVSFPYRPISQRTNAANSLRRLDGEVTQHLYRLPAETSVNEALSRYRQLLAQSAMRVVFECRGEAQCGRGFGAFLNSSDEVIPQEFRVPASFDRASALLAHGGDRATEHYLFILLMPQPQGDLNLYQQLVRVPRQGGGGR